MMNIYVGSYAGYNDGILDGTWVNLPCDEVKLWETIHNNCVDGAEEFGIFDYECEFMDISELDDIDELNEIAGTLETMGDYDAEIIKALLEDGCDLIEALDTKDDCIYYDTFDMGEIAERYYTECGMVDLDNYLSMFIDWEDVGRDMEINGHWIEGERGMIEVIR